jgi:hypothetical protein
MEGMTGMDVGGEGRNAGCGHWWVPWANETEGMAAVACEDT